MKKYSLCRDLMRNPRESEDSCIVASKWGCTVDVYLPEIPEVSNIQYFNLTAERLLYRNKVLSLAVDNALAECEAIQVAHPFGEFGPGFASFNVPSVRMAMAFVPLTPNRSDDKAILARLYCVAGLPKDFKSPFSDGTDLPGIGNYSWFVAGIPDKYAGVPLGGRSWLLAASLLMKVIDKNDLATAHNLSANFIVTGNVENGAIKEVEMGNKPKLAKINEYKNYKWIIPMKNANEMTNVSARQIEKPATLEEAYELIETMHNKATRSFFRFLKKFDFAGMQEQFDIGADIFAEDSETSLLPVEFITTAIYLAENSKEGENGKRIYQRSKIARHDIKMPEELDRSFLTSARRISEWLICQGACCAQTVYMLAKAGMFDAIAELATKYPIETRDGERCTAVDIALNNKEWEVARELYVRFGIKCDTTASRNKKLWAAIIKIDPNILNLGVYDRVCFPSSDFILVKNAMEVGLMPESQLLLVDQDPTSHNYRDEIRRTFFDHAISGGNENLVRLCLEKGADPNANLVSVYSFDTEECYTPLERASKSYDVDARDRIICLLKEFGAQETPKFLSAQNKNELAKALNDNAKRHEMYLDALSKLNSDKDNEQNHALIVECIKLGESMYQQMDCETSGEMGGVVGIRSSLWGMAIYFGWCDIVKACIEAGANINDDICYGRISFPEGFEEGLLMKKRAVEVVKGENYGDGRVKDKLLELLTQGDANK